MFFVFYLQGGVADAFAGKEILEGGFNLCHADFRFAPSRLEQHSIASRATLETPIHEGIFCEEAGALVAASTAFEQIIVSVSAMT